MMLNIKEYHSAVKRSARYYSAGNSRPGIRHVWMLCHGYGQLAREFIANCEPLLDTHSLLVAPEGLSRFYQRGGTGKIGASWMTSEDRLAEIDDYVGWLNKVWEEVCAECGTTPMLSVLGFSQGGATAARWGLMGKARASRIVLWGTTLPSHEITQHADALSSLPLVLVNGSKDRIVQRTEMDEGIKVLTDLGISYQQIEHSGGHELDNDILRSLRDIAAMAKE